MVRKRNALVRRFAAGKITASQANAALGALRVVDHATAWSFHADITRPKLVCCDPSGRTSAAADPTPRKGLVAAWALIGLFVLAVGGFMKSTQDDGRDKNAPVTTLAPDTTLAPTTRPPVTLAPPATKR